VSATRRHSSELGSVSYPDYTHFRDQTRTLKGLAAHYSTAPLFVAVRDDAREINGAVVSANFFPVLGVKPALGRFFRNDEDSFPDRDHVAVLGNDLWRDWFASSPYVLGATLAINGVPFTIIGVAPSTFRGVSHNPSQIYIPTMMLRVGYRFCDDSLSENCTILDMIGRLSYGHRIEEAMAEMATLMPRRWTRAAEGDNSGVTVFFPRVIHHDDFEVWFVTLLSLVAGVLLLVGCANLAGLLIARGTGRTREFAIRTSLGASSRRLVRQLLTESVLLAVIGGGFGLLVSLGMTDLLNSMFYLVDSEGHPLYFNFRLQPSVVFAALTASIIAGVLFGLLPAVKAARMGAAESLKRESSGVSTRSRLALWLVGGQAAIAVSLVAVAMLLSASARAVVNGTGFESSHVALLRLRPRLMEYPPAKAQQFQRAAIRRVETIAGVESVSLIGTGAVVLGGEGAVSLPGWSDASGSQPALNVGYGEIAPRYFETLRVPIVAGREFNEHDSVESPAVAIVSEALAHRLWPTITRLVRPSS
jgi:macrolide transport system ATP-binding/permease protein